MMAKPTVAFLAVPVPKCRCFHCLRIAELVDVCQVLRADAENTRRDLLTEREGTAMLLAERKRMEANSLDLARQLDQQRAEYWQAADLHQKENESLRLELSAARDDADYWKSLAGEGIDSQCESQSERNREAIGGVLVAACGAFAIGLVAGFKTWWGF